MIKRREFIAGLGSAAAWPLAAQAQPAPVPIIGVLNGRQPDAFADRWVAAFQQGLADAGFIVGKNVSIEFRWANLQLGQLPSLVSDLINRHVAVIFAADSIAPIRAAKAATATIPIVFYYGGDPVKDGFVASLSRPGGNMTGLTGMESELGPKRLALLHEMLPQAATIGFLTVGRNRAGPAIREAARSLGLELVEIEGTVLTRAFATFVERQVRAVLVDNVATLFADTQVIVRLEQQYKIPTMYPSSGAPRVGGLMGYQSKDVVGNFRQAASQYVARILNGAKPADLPVQQPTKFEFVINLKTAKALGLTVPETLLATADEVIQ
jgi:putative tryptophan/tyrosine transport system substrate-binding protein